MELVAALLVAGPVGYLVRTRSLLIYLAVSVVIFPIQTISVQSDNPDDINAAYFLINAAILAFGIAMNRLGARLRQRRRTAAAPQATILALALAVTMGACGDDDESGSSAKPQKLAIEVTEQGPDRFGLRAPRSVRAGLAEISLKTPPGKPITHDAQLVRIEGDHSIDEVLKFVGQEGAPTPDWLFAAGGVGQTKAGMIGSASQNLAPGRYFILDTSEPEGEDVKSYAERGATAELQVTGEPATAAGLPKADGNITAKDYSFTTRGLKAGRNTIEFDNAGRELHHVIAFPYRKGTTLAAVKKAFRQEGEPSGPPPVDFEGITGTAALEGGTKQVAELELKRGKYALVCFVSDRRGGPPHVAKGMIAEAKVE